MPKPTPLPVAKNTSVLEELVALAGRRALDVGCGEGHLVRLLTTRGARVTGLEVQPLQLERARGFERVGDEDYLEAGAQALPFPDASVDLVVFFNSLHHVPVAAMDQALAEAARVLRPGGLVYVSEPVAEGEFFELVKKVDDETEVRARAYQALQGAPRVGLTLVTERRFLHPMVLRDFEALRDRIVGADGARAAVLRAHEAELRAGLETRGRATSEGFAFEQPTRVNLLQRS